MINRQLAFSLVLTASLFSISLRAFSAENNFFEESIFDINGDSYFIVPTSRLYVRRPPDFYSLKYSTDNNVCENVAIELNMPHVTEASSAISVRRMAEALLRTEISVSFRQAPIPIDGFSSRFPRGIEYADLDIDNNGRSETVFRVSMSQGALLFEELFYRNDTLLFSEDIDRQSIAWETIQNSNSISLLDADLGKNIREVIVEIRRNTPQFANYNTSISLSSPLYYEPIIVNENSYVLAVDSTNERSPLNVFLLSISESRDAKLLCHYRSKYLPVPLNEY